MSLYALIMLITVAAIFLAYANERWLHIQTSIALTTAALFFSLIIILSNHFLSGFNLQARAAEMLNHIDFKKFLLDGLLGYLLFAGSLSINAEHLSRYKWEIATLACIGTVLSTLLIGTFSYALLALLHLNTPFLYCLIFGALISPTDPIAVLSIVKQLGAPVSLETTIAGESLFNDGIGLVLFVTLYELAFSHHAVSLNTALLLFLREAVGGVCYGLILGWLAYTMIKPLNHIKLELLITLCIPSFGYFLAQEVLAVSGPLAMVVSGILVGNLVRKKARVAGNHHLDTFWETIDEMLNALLFSLIGLELMVLHPSPPMAIAALTTIPLVLLARFITVSVPMYFFKRKKVYAPYVITVMTWGGLRGGLALAMALSLPSSTTRELILVLTYAVVIFSVIVQGFTAKPLVKFSQKNRNTH